MPVESPATGVGDATGGPALSPPAATPDAPASAPAPATGAPPATESIIHDPSAPPPSLPPDIVNKDGTFVPEWTEKLGDDFADSKVSLSKYRSVGDLIKAYQHANSLVGKKGIIPPTAESSPEELSSYRKAMGVPETPDAYAQEVKPKVEVPEGVIWNDDIAGQYFSLAHKHNIPAAAMRELVQLNLKQREFEGKAMTSAIAEKRQDGIKELRQLWGANFDRNIDLTRRAAARYGVDVEDPAWRSVSMVKAWARAMQDMGEDKFVGPGSNLPSGSADFKSKAKDIQTNPENPYYKKYWNGDPDTQQMVREYLRKSG